MRIGVLGGTFDPPHIGHLIAAQDAWAGLELDKVILMTAAEPPHKRDRELTPAALRLEMVRAAVLGDLRLEAGDAELSRPGPSYTVDTLRELRTSAPESALFFLMGADQFRELETWREPEEIARLAEIVVLSRGGLEEADALDSTLSHRALAVTRVDVSSSEVRRRVAAGEPIRYLVPGAVEAIIRREGLYS